MATLGFNRDAMVRALACHKCGQGSHPESDTIRVLRMLLLFALASRFSSRYSAGDGDDNDDNDHHQILSGRRHSSRQF